MKKVKIVLPALVFLFSIVAAVGTQISANGATLATSVTYNDSSCNTAEGSCDNSNSNTCTDSGTSVFKLNTSCQTTTTGIFN